MEDEEVLAPLDLRTSLPTPDGRTAERAPPTPERRSSRPPEYRFDLGGPFSRRSPGRNVEHDDIHMDTVSPRDYDGSNQMVRNAPPLPAAPRYSGATMQDRREFMRAYETYCHALSAYETTGVHVYRVPVGVCIDDRTRAIIAAYEFGKPVMDITESEWIGYFEQARLADQVDFEIVDEAMKKLKMTMSLKDAPSRMAKLVADMHRILDSTNMEIAITQREPRKLVEYLVDALEPAEFKAKVKSRLKQEVNEPLKKSPMLFVKWVTDLLRGYMLWENVIRTEKAEKTGNSRGIVRVAPRAKGPHTRLEAGPSMSRVPTGERVGHRDDGNVESTYVKRSCLKCGSYDHLVRQCPSATPDEKKKLLEGLKVGRVGIKSVASRVHVNVHEHVELRESPKVKEDRGTTRAVLDGVVVRHALIDSGADLVLVSRGVLRAWKAKGTHVTVEKAKAPLRLDSFGGGKQIVVRRRVLVKELRLESSQGDAVVKRVWCWIHEEDRQLHAVLGRPLMVRMGYSTDQFLVAFREKSEVLNIVEEDEAEEASPLVVSQLLAQKQLVLDAGDEQDRRLALPDPTPCNVQAVREALMRRKMAAVANGLGVADAQRLEELLSQYIDVFRLEFGGDPAVNVEPLLVRLKPDAIPVKCHARRYSPVHKEYLRKHIDELVKAGLLYSNPRSRWASPPRIVNKAKPGEYRMTVDTRGVNAMTEPMPWPMPDLESAPRAASKSRVFFGIDWFRGYWQLPLHPECQEFYTIMTDRGMFTPTRVLMGQTDAVAYCQSTVESIFGDMIDSKLLGWLDDLLGHATTTPSLLDILEEVLFRCAKVGLKLHPDKCDFFTTSAKWCGKVISANGVAHCPERVEGLVKMAAPITGGDLQQFLCAVNWMRGSIPNFTTIASPLMMLLETAAKAAKSRKKAALRRVVLMDIGWNEDHQRSLENLKEALVRMVPLAHPQDEAIVCVFTDASEDHWGAVVTQLSADDDEQPLEKQSHQPLAFLSGSFTGAASRWPTIEKEAFAIVETCKRLEYLLLRPNGFRLFTDHRNLTYIFDPLSTNANMARYQVDKLQRWAMTLTMFKYTIKHITGEANVWGDLLSRWGATAAKVGSVKVRQVAVVDQVSPLQSKDFEWPSAEEIAAAQQASIASRAQDDSLPDVSLDMKQKMYVNGRGQVWIPDEDHSLQRRLCIIAHAGIGGHRGVQATTKMLEQEFTWTTLRMDVQAFVQDCIHCLSIHGEMIPRPLGSALHATKPNEVIHFDFLSMPPSFRDTHYVLVLKDDMSGYCELVECITADAETVQEALTDWFKRFGVVHQWVSDQGAHFKNKVIDALRKLVGSHHHFVTAYTPWANGTVEVVNRVLLRCLKALLSELKLQVFEWPLLLPAVQSALNHTPADKLGNIAPVTAFTQLPASTPLKTITSPRLLVQGVTVEWVHAKQREQLQQTAAALEQMHKEVSAVAEKKRQQGRERHDAKRGVIPTNFQEGDYVLVGRVLTNDNKLALRWKGPQRIVRVIHDHTYEVQNLCPPYETSIRHASRLQLYRDKQLEVTSDLLDHIRHGEGGHLVQKLVELRRNPTTKGWEIQVLWVGLDPIEATWEPVEALYQDVPLLVDRFLAAKHDANAEAVQRFLAGKGGSSLQKKKKRGGGSDP